MMTEKKLSDYTTRQLQRELRKRELRTKMNRRRGDDIPTVADYAHWNEDAGRIWYEENRYDMEHWDEPIEPDEEDEREWDALMEEEMEEADEEHGG